MLTDLRHLSRSLRRSPASALAAIVTLSLAVGAGTAIFAVLDAVLFTPPPFADPGALVTVGETPIDEPTLPARAVRYATFGAWRERAGSLGSMEAYDATNLTLTELGTAERLSVTDVTPGFLTLLGVAPSLGRLFDGEDIGRPLAIVSHGFWRAKLAADPGAIGREIVLGGRAHTIVGVLPERFTYALNRCDVWRPLALPADQDASAAYPVRVVARLARHASTRDLEAALNDISRRSSPPAQAVATGMTAAIAGGTTRTLGLLASAAAVVFLIAFANLGGLLLVRSIDRRRELAIRMALGARRSEIARQLVLESEAVVALGIGGGVLLALWLTPVLGRIVLEQFGGVANGEVAVSWRVIGLIATAATLGGGICGLLPALVASRGNVVGVLSRGITAAPREPGLRRLFVAGEVALACVLLVLLSIVGRSLHDVLTVNPGFDARGLLTLQVSVPAASYADDERVASFYSALQRALEERLGTGTTSLINEMPLTGDGGRRLVRVRPSDAVREVVVREAGPGYFDVMRIAVAAGRPFDGRDGLAAPQRVVVSESLANALFGTGQPIGRHLRVGDPDAPPAEIIGVVGDVKHRALDEEGFLPTAYLSAWRSPSRSMILVVRSPKPDADVIAAVRQEVEALDRHVPVYRIRPMHDIVASSPGVAARHLLTATFMGFALLAVVLCGIGLFGIVAHDVASRRTELALRIALGADPTRIVLATLGRAGFTVGAGLAVGCATSLWAARAVSSVMFGPSPFDVLNLALAAAVLLAVGAAAVLPPARRAARTDPFSALRTE